MRKIIQACISRGNVKCSEGMEQNLKSDVLELYSNQAFGFDVAVFEK